MGTTESVLYAGYGPNSDPRMIEAITGERPEILGNVALLEHVELCLITLDEISNIPVTPEVLSAQEALISRRGIESGSRLFAARAQPNSIVLARPFRITPNALEAIWHWQLTDLGLFIPSEIRAMTDVKIDGSNAGNYMTELISDEHPIRAIVHGLSHPPFPMSRSATLAAAKRARGQIQ